MSGNVARDQAREIVVRLAALRDRRRNLNVLDGLLKFLAVVFFAVSAYALADILLGFPAPVRLLVLVAAILASVLHLVRRVFLPLVETVPDNAIARHVELAIPGLDNALVNSVELSRCRKYTTDLLTRLAVKQSWNRARQYPLEEALSYSRLNRPAAFAAVAVALLLPVLLLFGPRMSNSLHRLLVPWGERSRSFVPRLGTVRIVSVEPGDTEVFSGADVPVELKIETGGAEIPPAKVIYRAAGSETEASVPMTLIESGRYSCVLRRRLANTNYRVEAGRRKPGSGFTQSKWYEISVIERPTVTRIDLSFTYPEYTRMEPRKEEKVSGDIEAPVGTRVHFKIVANRPLAAAGIEYMGEQSTLAVLGGGPDAVGSVTIRESGDYFIRLATPGGISNDPCRRKIVAVSDHAPSVRFDSPAEDISAPPGGTLPIALVAQDDYALVTVRVRYRRGAEGEWRTLRRWKNHEATCAASFTYRWKLDPAEFALGDKFEYFAEARDRKETGRSKTWRIEVVSATDARVHETVRSYSSKLDRERAKASEELPGEREDMDGGDLPDDVRERLENLREALERFKDEQRKTINASREMAKIPVDDLTEEDREKIKELKAVEDDWAKFLRDMAETDYSTLSRQDFTDPVLLKEVLEIYVDVEVLAESLEEAAKEIAVPIEQAGLELAEEMTTHLEKWLPDEADRDKWSMEEPIGEFEVPMAEMPTELEDIIGELMEQEEELLEEADDVSSAWADSLDKGAGWDTLDGPISNYSAQGVTGNMLPNTSEIGGRSGEGRTGKAAGEMVEDSATGKGGRRTPTRLTPDSYAAGQIKDSSGDPAGGATGGGKLGGAGGEGLEGPVPPEVRKKMERLAGRQAQLTNSAERVALSLRLSGHAIPEIEATLAAMRRMQTDFKDGRYTNIARRGNVLLTGLGKTREFIEGSAKVQRDLGTVDKRILDEIANVTDEDEPEGYEELIAIYRSAIAREKNGGQ